MHTKKKHTPLLNIVLSFAIVILIGTLLLLLPFSTVEGKHFTFVDALFTSTSAVCVTGLVPIPSLAESLTIFGKIVLALLIQIGGLGFVTIAIFVLVALGARVGIANRYLAKEALNQSSANGIVKLILWVMKVTLVIEFVGFVLSLIVFAQDYPFLEACGISAFHAISAFNNCGMDIIGSQSLLAYKDNILLNITTSLMIILGGIGFIVMQDVISHRRWRRLATHSQIVIKVTTSLIVIGMIFLKITEGNDITWLQAFFHSVSARTAGFSTIQFGLLKETTLITIIILMFIGASPSSTGGGIKTTTFYVMYKSITSFARGKKAVTAHRKISEDTKLRAFTLTSMALGVILLTTFLLLMFEQNSEAYVPTISNILFEVTSAFGTVGLSVGITPYLTDASKIILCVVMFFGRLGPLTILGLWNKNWNRASDSDDVDYINAKIIIG